MSLPLTAAPSSTMRPAAPSPSAQERKRPAGSHLPLGLQQRCVRNTLRTIFGLFILAVYLTVGAVFYKDHAEYSWSNIDSVYFMFATMSTVGYGDFSPVRQADHRIFTIFMSNHALALQPVF